MSIIRDATYCLRGAFQYNRVRNVRARAPAKRGEEMSRRILGTPRTYARYLVASRLSLSLSSEAAFDSQPNSASLSCSGSDTQG